MKKFAIFGVVMIIGAGVALASAISVPFYRDGTDAGFTSVAVVGVKDTTGVDQTITITYTSLNASTVLESMTVTYALGADVGVAWRPVFSGGSEGVGSLVGDNTIIGPSGSVDLVGSISIAGTGLAGRYNQLNVEAGNAFGHALVTN